MKYLWVLVILSLVFLSGCSGKPQKLDSKDPAVYALRIKTQVYEMVAEVKRNPKSAREQGSVLLEELEGYQSQPVGQHEAVYAELLQKCRELAAGTQVNQNVNAMKALADKLPGTVTPVPRE